MSLPPPESQKAPERHLDNASPGANTSLPQVDRIALLKDFKAGDACPANSLPGLTLVGCEKPAVAPHSDAAKPTADATKPATDATKPATDATKPSTDATPDGKALSIDNAKKALESPDATIKQKMDALTSLYDNLPKGKDGNAHVTLNDGGKPKDFEISRNDAGKDVHLLQLSTSDQHGNSHPVLRGVERRGDVEEQRHANGAKAGYQGDWWSGHAKESTISKFAQTNHSDAPAPPSRPADAPAVPTPPSRPADAPAVPTPPPRPAEAQDAPASHKHHEGSAAPAPHKHHDGSTAPAPHKHHDGSTAPAPHKHHDGSTAPAPHKHHDASTAPAPHRHHDGSAAPAPHRHHAASDPERQPESKPERKPVEAVEPETKGADGRVIVSNSDRSKFYTRQDDNHSCAAMAVAMLDAHQRLGRPVQLGAEAQHYKAVTGTLEHGYRGSLETMAGQMKSIGLDAKAYDYGMGNVGPQAIKDLNRELDQGHSAVAKVINPHTGNAHYIMIEGRDKDGKYILGDPDRKNAQHFEPVSAAHLMHMMGPRDGFVAGWRRGS